MNKILSAGIALALCLGVTGCGTSIKFTGTKVTTDPTTGSTTTEYGPGELAIKDAEEAKQLCYERAQKADAEEFKALVKVPEDKLALLLMNRQNEKALLMMAGKYQEQCKPGTNLYDVAIAEITQKNETARAIAPIALVAAGGAYTAKVITDGVVKIADGAGPKTATTIQGDGNQAEIKNERTSIDNKVTSTASGDGVASTTSNPHNASSPAAQAAPGGGTSAADAAFEQCKGAGTGTMGQVGSCMALSGQDVEIKGGQMYVGGSLYGPGNSYAGYTPVIE